MKKIFLATLVSLLAGTVNAATVYSDDSSKLDLIGRGKININNNKANSSHRMSGTARLGVDGKTNVNDSFGLFARVLYDLSAQDTENLNDRIKIREAWIGFDFKDYGKITLGRYKDAFYNTTSVTDIYLDWGKHVPYWGYTKNDFGGRKDGQIKYDVEYNGFSLSASYQFKQSNKYINYGVGATVGYELELGNSAPIGVMAGYNHYEGLKSASGSGWNVNGLYYGADKNEVAASLYYGNFGAPGLYAAIAYNYAKLENTYKTNGLETTVSYTTPNRDWIFSVEYSYFHNSDDRLTKISLNKDNSLFSSVWTGEIIYNLTQKFQIYTELEHKYESVVQKESENLVSLGFIYNF